MNQTTAQVSKRLDAQPDAVWTALMSPAKLKRFFYGAEVITDWKVGSSIVMKGEFKGKPYADTGTILAVERERTLSFSHFSPLTGEADVPESYHVVTFTLEGATGGTEVTLTQSNLLGGVRPGDLAHRADYEQNWSGVLDRLATVVDEGPLRT
jgi:uncharacterized protein YndB with AHSA1/START domain